MFDWPAQNQTSPMRIFFKVIVLLALIVISCGPPAFMAGSQTNHLPFVSAFVLKFLPAKRIVIFSFFGAHPHIFSFVSR
jgi:hypothetical protein